MKSPVTTPDPAPTTDHEQPAAPTQGSRRKLLARTALCSTFLLLQCTKPDRDYDAILPGSGGRKGEGGEGGEPLAGDTGAGGAPAGGRSTGGLGGDTDLGGAGASAGGASGGAPPCGDNSDPDCRCVEGSLVAKDIDGDGEGTRLCEAAPGLDCDDGDDAFVKNDCGGCIKDLGGSLDDACGQCGVLKCQGDSALVCRSPSPQPQRCTDANTPQLCVDGNWVVQSDCTGGTPVCLNGSCVQCNPGAPINTLVGQEAREYRCDTTSYAPDDVVYRCSDGGAWETSWILSCYASSAEACDATTGSCVTAGIPHPRDTSFEVVPALLKGVYEKQMGRPVLEVFDSLLGSKFG
jgi:hypothetical protein